MASIDKIGGLFCENTKNSYASIEVMNGDMDDQESWVASSERRDEFQIEMDYKTD